MEEGVPHNLLVRLLYVHTKFCSRFPKMAQKENSHQFFSLLCSEITERTTRLPTNTLPNLSFLLLNYSTLFRALKSKATPSSSGEELANMLMKACVMKRMGELSPSALVKLGRALLWSDSLCHREDIRRKLDSQFKSLIKLFSGLKHVKASEILDCGFWLSIGDFLSFSSSNLWLQACLASDTGKCLRLSYPDKRIDRSLRDLTKVRGVPWEKENKEEAEDPSKDEEEDNSYMLPEDPLHTKKSEEEAFGGFSEFLKEHRRVSENLIRLKIIKAQIALEKPHLLTLMSGKVKKVFQILDNIPIQTPDECDSYAFGTRLVPSCRQPLTAVDLPHITAPLRCLLFSSLYFLELLKNICIYGSYLSPFLLYYSGKR